MSFQYELTTKQRFYLYLFQLCPLISIIDILWRLYKDESDKLILQDYSEIMLSEFTNNKISVKTEKFTSFTAISERDFSRILLRILFSILSP